MSSSESDIEVQNTPPKKKKYSVSYKPDWEKDDLFEGWLSKSNKGPDFAYCKVCSCDINITRGGKNDIKRHKETKKHESNKLKIRGQQSLDQMITKKSTSLEKLVKQSEIRIAAFIVEHNIPINVMEHFPDLIRAVCPDSEVAKRITCGRTKTTKIISEVLGRSDVDIMVEAMQTNRFSLTADESTDKSTKKHLAVIVRIARSNLKVEDYFFELFEILEGNAEKLHEIITKKMTELGIPYKKNMIGLAADGANVMMGKNNSLATKFKQDIPHLFVMKCVCHSVHLVASNACLKLPREPEDLARDVYNYLNGSPKRTGLLKEFQDFLELKPHKLLQPSQTRWLSLEAVVKRLLEQYEALKLYFRDAIFSDRIKAAENILKMIENPVNKLYLQFMAYALGIFNELNRTMQSENTNVHIIYNRVMTVIYTILGCYVKDEYISRNDHKNIDYKNPRKYMDIKDWYLGAEVGATLSSPTLTISPEEIKKFKFRCLEFYIEAIKQLLQRFPFEDDMEI
ncbi:uncharacterized protein LOC121735744 isoform X1 [Aricia agestis]|uniref:uncharacterized protein LOC121732645 isoform X1 n=1 Tax=Aricia agestis TaxID=91739 RepID=UPI001C203FF8|nr:uncharacterized protein LOC121732645 isoform X1 [Aricia agestis]XP_041982594.1 uncharacterized protein LOC121735744 isoform X1 [Aricia agestis]